jgi:hypothetical protein
MGLRRKTDWSTTAFTLLRAAGQIETKQENIQDWLHLDEGDPTFQLLREEEIAAVIFFILFSIYLFC